MVQRFLLPNYFKRLGAIMTPVGLFIWIITQQGVFNNVLINNQHGISWPLVTVLVISFFSFLFGLYFLAFAKEKNEDEYIQRLRLQSFQLSAMVQLVSVVISFITMVIINKEPEGDGGLELFLIIIILFFWVFYITHFNYTLYRTNKLMNEKFG